MRCVLFYYSHTGNTRLTCLYMKEAIRRADILLVDIQRDPYPSLFDDDIVGFAFYTDAFRPPAFLLERVRELPLSDKYTFFVGTFGSLPGKCARILQRELLAKGARVLSFHMLHTPENYPPMIAAGLGASRRPSPKDLRNFDRFLSGLDRKFADIDGGRKPSEDRPRIGLLNAVMPSNAYVITEKVSGPFRMEVLPDKCNACGLCVKNCPAKALRLQESAVLDLTLCQKCWSCYNHCPRQAIVCGKYRGTDQYRGPHPLFAAKMAAHHSANAPLANQGSTNQP